MYGCECHWINKCYEYNSYFFKFFGKRNHLLIVSQVKDRIHKLNYKIHQSRAVEHNFLCLLLTCTNNEITQNALYRSHFKYHCQENGLPAILRAEDKLRQALEPAHIQLLSQISKLPGGVKDIVDMRNDLLVREDF